MHALESKSAPACLWFWELCSQGKGSPASLALPFLSFVWWNLHLVPTSLSPDPTFSKPTKQPAKAPPLEMLETMPTGYLRLGP